MFCAICAAYTWVKERSETADDVAKRAAKCWRDAERAGRDKGECADLYLRAKALEMREQAEQFCKDKGLKFKGTIGDQTECEP